MYEFQSITPTNGFDFENLNNARQNNYAWSMAELDGYIYVGTGRNILLLVLQSLTPDIDVPALIEPHPQANLAEIWRYKKDGSLPWKRVYRAPIGAGITGFRFMISATPMNGSPCLFAATLGKEAKVLKSTNGVNWFQMPDTLEGTSSRAMAVIKNKIYIATVNDSGNKDLPMLYSSKDPEFYPWENIIDTNNPDFDSDKNPQGGITNMVVYNEHLYVGTSNSQGVQVWRTNSEVPKLNDWTLVVDNGFGDKANQYILSMGIFKDLLYVSGTKPLPLSWALPMGCDIIRINHKDQWQLVVGGRPLIPAETINGQRGFSVSGLKSGFNNPFNVYAWQIQEYKGKLFISTFDDSSNMEVILTTLLANKEAFEEKLGEEIANLIILAYKGIVSLLKLFKYPIGFDLYVSENGVNFKAITKNGLNNPNNYGGRILFVDKDNDLYLGTANPFQGCEVYKLINCIKDNMSDDLCNEEVLSNDIKIILEMEKYMDVIEKYSKEILETLSLKNN